MKTEPREPVRASDWLKAAKKNAVGPATERPDYEYRDKVDIIVEVMRRTMVHADYPLQDDFVERTTAYFDDSMSGKYGVEQTEENKVQLLRIELAIESAYMAGITAGRQEEREKAAKTRANRKKKMEAA